MSDAYIGTILYFGGNYAIRGYAFCQGQTMSIQQNSALFAVLGVTYGGDGQTTFGLPDLRGRVPVGQGQGPSLSPISLGQKAGNEQVTLTVPNLPPHNHVATFTNNGSTLNASTDKANAAQPAAGNLLARSIDSSGSTVVPQIYGPSGGATVGLGGLNVAGTVTVSPTGSGLPVAVRDPYLGLNPLICTQGLFPSRN